MKRKGRSYGADLTSKLASPPVDALRWVAARKLPSTGDEWGFAGATERLWFDARAKAAALLLCEPYELLLFPLPPVRKPAITVEPEDLEAQP